MNVWEGKRFAVAVENGYEIARTPDAVAILALDTQDRIVLVSQRRTAVGDTLLELPAGLIDEGEAPLETAKRELREETGLHGGRWRELTSFWTSPGFVDERVTVFLADELEEGDPDPDEAEDIEVVRWTLQELEARVDELDDATTLVGLLLFLRARSGMERR